MRILDLVLAAVAGAIAAAGGPATAQTYPTRLVTIVDTFPPGGSVGIVARIIADKLSEPLGQSVIVDSRGGAGGTVAARQIAKTAPDGYTLMLAFTGTMAIAPNIYPNAGYDPRKDFAPISLLGVSPTSLVTNPSTQFRSVADVISEAKRRPGEIGFGTAGVGTVGHVAGELLATTSGIKLVHVPYRGTGPALTDVLGNHIPLVFAPLPSSRENVRAGTLRMIGVTSLERTSVLPDAPTIAEQGLPGYEAVLRYGLVAPAGTPRAVIDRLNAAVRVTLASDDVRKRFATEGIEPKPSSPEEYAADIDREEAKWSALVRSIGIKAE